MNKKRDLYFFYNGLKKPREINIGNIKIDNKYLGSSTELFLKKHDKMAEESDENYNEEIKSYYIFRNPTLEELIRFNEEMSLPKLKNLSDFL